MKSAKEKQMQSYNESGGAVLWKKGNKIGKKKSIDEGEKLLNAIYRKRGNKVAKKTNKIDLLMIAGRLLYAVL